MTENLKKALVSEMATIIWRAIILGLIAMSCWTFQRQINRIDAHDVKITQLQQFMTNEFVKKYELCELKSDVKSIQETLNKTLPEISMFMGQTAEYMRTDGGKK